MGSLLEWPNLTDGFYNSIKIIWFSVCYLNIWVLKYTKLYRYLLFCVGLTVVEG